MSYLKAKHLSSTSQAVIKEAICPVCLDRFLAGHRSVDCPVCGRAYHAKCWEYNDNECAVLNCAGTGSVRQPAAPIRSAFLNAQITDVASLVDLLLAPRPAMFLSWFLTTTIAYCLIRLTDSGSLLGCRASVLSGVALFAAATSTAYDSRVEEQPIGWHSRVVRLASGVILGIVGLALAPASVENLSTILGTDGLGAAQGWTANVLVPGTLMGAGAHVGAWNTPRRFRGLVHPLLRVLTAVSLSSLMAVLFATRLDSLLALARRLGRPMDFYLPLVLGAAMGSTLSSRLGLWTGTPHRGVRRMLELVIATTCFATLGAILSHLTWNFFLVGLLAETDLHWRSISMIHWYAAVSWAVLGAAYGTSEPARSGLTITFRVLTMLVIGITVLSVTAIGAYVGYAVAQEQFAVTDRGFLSGAAIVGAVVVLLILRALHRFFRGIVTSSSSD